MAGDGIEEVLERGVLAEADGEGDEEVLGLGALALAFLDGGVVEGERALGRASAAGLGDRDGLGLAAEEGRDGRGLGDLCGGRLGHGLVASLVFLFGRVALWCHFYSSV